MANTGKPTPGAAGNDHQKNPDAGKKGGQGSSGGNVANDRKGTAEPNKGPAKRERDMPHGGAGRKA